MRRHVNTTKKITVTISSKDFINLLRETKIIPQGQEVTLVVETEGYQSDNWNNGLMNVHVKWKERADESPDSPPLPGTAIPPHNMEKALTGRRKPRTRRADGGWDHSHIPR